MLTAFKRRRVRAFTLLEIMIVVMIIGMLAAITGTSVIQRLKSAKIKIAKTYVKGAGAQALEMYFTDNGFYPTTDQGIAALMHKPTSSPVPKSWTEPYLKEIPQDPWGEIYHYNCPGDKSGNDFDLWSAGPDRVSGTSDDIGNWPDEEQE